MSRQRGCRLALRPYQKAAVSQASERNIICVLPTNSGKTIIAAALTEKILLAENEATQEDDKPRKVIFLAPTRALAQQQANVLLDQIHFLKGGIDDEADDGEDYRRRLRLIVGGAFGEGDTARSVQRAQVAVMTPRKFEDALVRGYLQMDEVALLILDEAHHTRGDTSYAMVMKYFYNPCEARKRPRILALTASPVEKSAAEEPKEQAFKDRLKELESDLDATAWSQEVKDEWCPHPLPHVLRYVPSVAQKEETVDGLEHFAMGALRNAKPDRERATHLLKSAEEATRLCEAWEGE